MDKAKKTVLDSPTNFASIFVGLDSHLGTHQWTIITPILYHLFLIVAS